ncbi:hypothetical protein [Variovorax sp. UC74_104]
MNTRFSRRRLAGATLAGARISPLLASGIDVDNRVTQAAGITA